VAGVFGKGTDFDSLLNSSIDKRSPRTEDPKDNFAAAVPQMQSGAKVLSAQCFIRRPGASHGGRGT
jgi:hypothetical protein